MSLLRISRRGILVVASLCFVLALLTASSGCSKSESDAQDVKAGEDSGKASSAESSADADTSQDSKKEAREEKPVSVNVCNAFKGDLVVPVVAEGTIRARRSAELRFEISGKITRILVHEGQTVRKGQLLAELDGREYSIKIEEAHSRYLQALGKVAVEEDGAQLPSDSKEEDEFHAQMRKLSQMEARGEITRSERLDREIELGMKAVGQGGFRRALVEARSGMTQARADEDQARLNLEKTQIRAPFAGVLTGLTLAAGEWVNANQTFASLVDNVDIEAEVGVLESDLKSLEVGRPVLLAVPALEDTFPVKVDVISPSIDTQSRTCQVLMRLHSEDGRVRPGMFVRAFIAGKILKDRLLVPRDAILTRDGRPLLFKVEEGRSKWVYIQPGAKNSLFVEVERVLQGGPLKAGTPVVISDNLTLAHDAKIKVRKTITPPDAWASFDRIK